MLVGFSFRFRYFFRFFFRLSGFKRIYLERIDFFFIVLLELLFLLGDWFWKRLLYKDSFSISCWEFTIYWDLLFYKLWFFVIWLLLWLMNWLVRFLEIVLSLLLLDLFVLGCFILLANFILWFWNMYVWYYIYINNNLFCLYDVKINFLYFE